MEGAFSKSDFRRMRQLFVLKNLFILMFRISVFTAILLLSLIIGVSDQLHSQYVIDWSKTFGNQLISHEPWKVRNTNDGGYIVVGRTQYYDEVSNTISSPFDCWVMKLDKAGDIEWSRNYGGSKEDIGWDAMEVEDGAFIINATSQSNDGDVPENQGGYDCWIFKLNKKGEVVWQKILGNIEDDFYSGIIKIDKSGYFMSSNTFLTIENQPKDLMWLSKLDENGNTLWVKNYTNTDSTDNSIKLLDAKDGNLFVVSGNSRYVTPGGDYISIRKINVNGETIWESKTYLPNDYLVNDIQLNGDGNAVCLSSTDAQNPDFTPNDGNIGIFSIPLNEAGALPNGIYGGTGIDVASTLQPLSNGNYLASGITTSPDGNIAVHYGLFDWWLFLIDKSGKIIWEKNFGGSGSELLFSMEPTNDGGFILAGLTSSYDYDVTTSNEPVQLGWIVKILPVNTSGICDSPNIYPNPSNTDKDLIIEMPQAFGTGSSIEVYDLTGRMILQMPAEALENKSKIQISATQLPKSGIYFVRTNCGEQVHILKFIRLSFD